MWEQQCIPTVTDVIKMWQKSNNQVEIKRKKMGKNGKWNGNGNLHNCLWTRTVAMEYAYHFHRVRKYKLRLYLSSILAEIMILARDEQDGSLQSNKEGLRPPTKRRTKACPFLYFTLHAFFAMYYLSSKEDEGKIRANLVSWNRNRWS